MVRLAEALQIIAQAAGERKRGVHLLVGSMPLHLETFVRAHLALRFPNAGSEIITGLYGDLEGNIQRARDSAADGAIVVIEWSDLDQRLGFRASAGWRTETLADIFTQVEEKCQRIETRLKELADAMPLVLVGPSLGLPPITHEPPALTSTFELRLNTLFAQFLVRVCAHQGIRLAKSPAGAGHDVKMDLLAGFPYTLAHADAIAELSVSCLFPIAPKKGVITDLDETLWKGVLGDAGVDGVTWSLDGKSQAHALYQQVLASLADSGVLVAIASKNDPQLVESALQRPDILLKPAQMFPVEAGWGAKSDAVGRILDAWNISADSVVFVDDSPMELAEVAEKHPGIECLQFPTGDPAAIIALLWRLRARFGKSEIREEDHLRIDSLRAAAVLKQESAAEVSSDFLSRLDARITLHSAGADPRAFELVNKTNQFNLNGVRYTEAEWKALSQRPGSFLATLSYEDRFGPLGKVAVLGGYREGAVCCVDVWVMSCRAFSRQIEFQFLRQLFDKSGASEVRFRFTRTDRNGPLQSFLTVFVQNRALNEGDLRLPSSDFKRLCPPMFHQVSDQWTLSETN